jgi:CheY-like chemotaxis protein/two-component sensor histidine kinase
MSLDRGTFSLAAVIELTVGMIGESAARRRLELTTTVDPEVDQLTGDERKVKQVLINLLANAVKFTPDGGKIAVEARRAGDRVEVTVRDTGIGLSPEDQLRIFDAFQQGDAAANPLLSTAQGTGLGLTLARKFVELHGGRIWVESEVDHGSTFTFTLPFHSPRVRPTRPVDAPTVIGDGPTVLLVEDDPHAVELLSVYLREAGFSVAVTDDAAEALGLAVELQPVAMTLDILLPGSELDGWDLLAQLKTTPRTADIPVIVVSIVDERGKGFALGAADYLVKPLRREDLLAALSRLGLSSLQRLEPASVLLIEHDQANAEQLAGTLRSVGYTVSVAASGQAGLGAARSNPPSLLIIDLLLPDIDGIAVAELLHADPNTRATPILMLTAHDICAADKARLRNRVEFLAGGSDFDGQAFLETVRRLQPAVLL